MYFLHKIDPMIRSAKSEKPDSYFFSVLYASAEACCIIWELFKAGQNDRRLYMIRSDLIMKTSIKKRYGVSNDHIWLHNTKYGIVCANFRLQRLFREKRCHLHVICKTTECSKCFYLQNVW